MYSGLSSLLLQAKEYLKVAFALGGLPLSNAVRLALPGLGIFIDAEPPIRGAASKWFAFER
jgi:hypothetical protein